MIDKVLSKCGGLSNCKKYWKMRGFDITVLLAIIFLLVFGVYRRITGQKGTYSKNFTPLYESILEIQPLKIRDYEYKQKRESSGEIECRKALYRIFKRDFPKERPSFLANTVTGGNNLELDCFNRELRLAVEYNGKQHYEYIPYFHKTKDSFYNQKYRDEMKERLCRENGIKLITVPYTVSLPDIENYIRSRI